LHLTAEAYKLPYFYVGADSKKWHGSFSELCHFFIGDSFKQLEKHKCETKTAKCETNLSRLRL